MVGAVILGMTRLTVNVELDEAGRPVFRLTPAQLAELGLQGSAAHEARWEVEGAAASPLRQWIGIAPKLEQGSLEFYRELKGHNE